MKKYFSWFFSIILLFLISILYYLFQSNRIILKYEKIPSNITQTNTKDQLPINFMNIQGIYYNENFELKKIPLQIADEEYKNNTNQEKILATYLHKYFYYLNLEKNNLLSYFLNHVTIDGKSAIINLHIEKKEKLSLEEEYHILRGLFITIKNIISKIETVYFFDNEKPLNFNYLIPFFTSNFLIEPLVTELIKENNQSNVIEKIYIIPLINNNGNKCEDTYEKNIFQSFLNSELIFFPKKEYPLFFEEINQLTFEIPKKLIIYANINIKNKTKIKIYHYPINSTKKIKNIKTRWFIPSSENINNNLYLQKLSKIQNLECNIAPIIPITQTIYPSLYISIEAPNIKESKIILNNLITQLLSDKESITLTKEATSEKSV